MNNLLLSIATICTLFYIKGLKAENIPTINLQRCFDFPDDINSTEFSLDNYPTEYPADGRQIHYTLSGSIDFEKNGTCQRIELGRLFSHNGHERDIKLVSVSSELILENHNHGDYITRDGSYFDGVFYHQLANYCVFRFGYYPNTKTSWFTDIRICEETTVDENHKRAYCVKKCCAPNFIIDYATRNCRPLKPNEPGWTPKVCDNSDCQYINYFCRHGYGLYKPGLGKSCVDAAVVRYSSNVKLEKANSQLQLMYKASNGKWSRYEHEYCMDGIVDHKNLTFKNTPVDQAVVVCKREAEGIDVLNSGYKLIFSQLYVLIFVLVTCFVVKDA
ncbi:unnamed protein product [Orchesella dallaii]|uniref:Uncharacterized protein n=1 Tax=Orchesella dallaii TaxID=48710 RepID=A0ABP1QC44_9HEXA